MADPLGPCILSIIFLILSSLVYALISALPWVDESSLRHENGQASARDARVLRMLDRFDNGYGEIRMTYAVLLMASFSSLWVWLGPIVNNAFPFPALVNMLIGLLLFALVSFALTVIVPGSLAANHPENILKISAVPAEWAVIALTPITKGAYYIGKAILHPFHIKPGRAVEHVSEEEIRMMVDIGEEKGTIETDEKEMIENIFEFNNMSAEDCMIHRKDVTALDIESTEDEVMQVITESGLSRFPVYEDTIDNIIGILTSRDFLISRCSDNPKPFRELIRPAHFVPESVRTDVLFREMQVRKQHMSIVIDEYGGTSGLITLEDLLEEIVGNIYDEFDPKEEQDITPLPNGTWRVAGSVELETLNDTLGTALPLDEEYDTLGGLVFSHLTEIPADGEQPVVECYGMRISVTEIADRRVEWVLLEKLPEEDHSAQDEGNSR